MLILKTHSAEETRLLAAQLANKMQAGDVISLKGHLGSGKTTFSQGFAKELGVKRAVKSPTYTIVKQYPLDDKDFIFNHIDAYRLEDGGADSVDLDSFMNDTSLTIIEWAEFVLDYMPESYIEIELSQVDESQRELKAQVIGKNKKYHAIISEWSQDWKGM
ncbi:tRNA (adenosine(37)-N6)-threonylcarbamoyltransferase complex ATPase subunit type 1 TsaE [Aerococcaceae bacterium WGS1372]